MPMIDVTGTPVTSKSELAMHRFLTGSMTALPCPCERWLGIPCGQELVSAGLA
jgi:hypothetical protein